ncbi:hypothetical protein FRB99_004659 [Tulasnella sp. 403]|nr:hypothetical protein FRB99_004659 [Tulasnella sp. 403]
MFTPLLTVDTSCESAFLPVVVVSAPGDSPLSEQPFSQNGSFFRDTQSEARKTHMLSRLEQQLKGMDAIRPSSGTSFKHTRGHRRSKTTISLPMSIATPPKSFLLEAPPQHLAIHSPRQDSQHLISLQVPGLM